MILGLRDVILRREVIEEVIIGRMIGERRRNDATPCELYTRTTPSTLPGTYLVVSIIRYGSHMGESKEALFLEWRTIFWLRLGLGAGAFGVDQSLR